MQVDQAAGNSDAGRVVLDVGAGAGGVVLGAPGTGKTTLLLERVRRLVAEGTPADGILVITPSRHTATALRDRLALGIGGTTSGSPARSITSFAFQIVRAAALARGGPAPRLLTGADQDRIIADLVGDDDGAEGRIPWPEALGAQVRLSREFRTQLRALAAECAELDLTPDSLATLAAARGHGTWAAAAAFLEEYRFVLDGMREAHRDSAELLREAAGLIAQSRRGVPGWPTELRAVLVDDAQELTRGGVDLLLALRDRGVAVLAFGDPDIGSGAFRGASPALFARLCEELGQVHVLDAQRRSGATITDLVRTVSASIGAAGRVDHRRAPGAHSLRSPGEVRAVLAPSPFEEIDIIARTLREWHVSADIAWDDMAVLAHDTRQVADLDRELAAREVPTRAAGVQRPLGREQIVRDILDVVRVATTDPVDWDRADLAGILLSPFGGLDAVGLRRVRARLRHAELASGGNRAADELLAEALAHPLVMVVAEGQDGPELRVVVRVAETLTAVRDAARAGAGIHELLWIVWDAARDESGRRVRTAWAEVAATREPTAAEVNRALDALVALFDAAKRHEEQSPGDGPGPFIRRILDSDVPEDTLAAPETRGAVAILTPDAALGSEFEAVVIAGVQDGVWPNLRLRGGLLDTWRLADDVQAWRAGEPAAAAPEVLDRRRAALHDELRLFVRAISRARSRLVVSAVDDDDLGPSPLFAFLPDPEDTRAAQREAEHPFTLRGLVAHHRRTLTTSTAPATRAHAAGQLVVLARAGVPGAAPSEWYGVTAPSSLAPLRDPDAGPISVSPSKLGQVAECPLDWAIRALGGDTRTWSAGVGTILHAAMETVPDGNLEGLRRVVDERWSELTFEAPWLGTKERLWAETLTERLHHYLHRFHEEGGRALGAEQRFRLAVDITPGRTERTVVPVAEGERLEGRYAVLSGSIDRVEAYPVGRGEGVPAGSSERVLVADLKTGRSEKRLADAKVTDDPQLAAYQLAVYEGLIAGVDPSTSAGARLVVLSHTTKTNPHYRLARQEPMDAAAREAFLERVFAAAQVMASSSFLAPVDAHCSAARYGACTLHTVKAVSAA